MNSERKNFLEKIKKWFRQNKEEQFEEFVTYKVVQVLDRGNKVAAYMVKDFSPTEKELTLLKKKYDISYENNETILTYRYE